MTQLFVIAIHNVALATLLAVLVWIVTRIWKNPAVAHLLWLLVLVKLVTPPLVNLELGGWLWRPETSVIDRERGGFTEIRQSLDDSSRAYARASSSHLPSNVESNAMEVATSQSVANESPSRKLSDPPRIAAIPAWDTIRPLLILVWMGGITIIAILVGTRTIRFHRMLAGTLPASQRLQTVATELCCRMGLRRSPDVRVADGVAAPLVWCVWGRAIIVLPLNLLGSLNDDQSAMVLAHELAHLRRRDHWVRMIELVISILHWWNPLVWSVRRQLHAVEEQCCDAWVAWLFPDRSLDYAQSLLKAAELAPCQSSPLVLYSPFLNRNTLKARIEIVLKNSSQRSVSRWTLLCLVALAAGVIPTGVLTGRTDTGRTASEEQVDVSSPMVEVEHVAANAEDLGENSSITSDDQSIAKETSVAVEDGDIPVVKELLPFQGLWNFASHGSSKWPAEPEEFRAWQWAINGQEITWTRPGQESVKLNFTVEPGFTRDSKKRWTDIDFMFLDGPDKAQKCLGSFYWWSDPETIWICYQDPGVKGDRPKKSGFNGYGGITVIALQPASRTAGSDHKSRPRSATQREARAQPAIHADHEKPIANELRVFQGKWNFDLCDSILWSTNLGVIQKTWKWQIKGQEITWIRQGKEPVKMAFKVDASKTPNEIDFTILDGPDKGEICQGIYEFERNGIWVCMTEPGAKVERPTKMQMTGSSKTALIVLGDKDQDRTADPAKPEAMAKAEDRGAEIDAAIARLRKQGAKVREFHPRDNPEYWVQIVSENLNDAALQDVEIIGRGVPLFLHLNNSSVTTTGLGRLSSAKRIGQLELSGDNINDAILKVLPKLPLQGQLGLYSDQLTNAGIQTISECSELTSISLDGNLLTNSCLEHLTGLPKLQRILLGKSFTREAFDYLARLPGLTNLDVSSISPQISDLRKVPNLRTIRLSGTEYNDETARTIADTFVSLDSAYLPRTSITNVGVQHLSRLEKLTTLTLDGAPIDDGIADSIRKMKQLKWLSVGDCKIGDDTLAAISECPDMWYLFLVNTPVTDKGIEHLAKLKKPLNLYLAHCKFVTDASIKSLGQLPNSENLHLNLQSSGITEDGARELQAMLPDAQISWGIPPFKLKK